MEEFFDLSKYSPKIPLSRAYHSKLDTSNFLNDRDVSLFHFCADALPWEELTSLCSRPDGSIPGTVQGAASHDTGPSVWVHIKPPNKSHS